MGNKEALQKFKDMRSKMLAGGGADQVAKQHERGKLTARERINLLFDEGSFIEDGTYMTGRADKFGLDKKKFLGDGVVTGCGKVDGKCILSACDLYRQYGMSCCIHGTFRG